MYNAFSRWLGSACASSTNWGRFVLYVSAGFTKRLRVEGCRLLAFILATLAFRHPYFKSQWLASFVVCATTLFNEESTFFALHSKIVKEENRSSDPLIKSSTATWPLCTLLKCFMLFYEIFYFVYGFTLIRNDIWLNCNEKRGYLERFRPKIWIFLIFDLAQIR